MRAAASAAAPAPAGRGPDVAEDRRRRITHLMLLRVVLVTIVLAATAILSFAAPSRIVTPNTLVLFGLVGLTYALTLIYAVVLRRVQRDLVAAKQPAERGKPPATGLTERALARLLLLADAQVAGDLAVTTLLVHVTGGAQSAYVFFYPLSIIGAAMVRYQRGAAIAAVASVALFVSISLAGWLGWLPVPLGQSVLPWDMTTLSFVRHLLLHSSAFLGVAVLASLFGQQLLMAGERLESAQAATADLSVLNENIIRCLSSGLVSIDGQGFIIAFNQAAKEILGVTPEGALGRPLADLVPEISEILARLPLEASLKRGEIAALGPGAERIALGVSIVPLHDHRGVALGRIINFQDLTQLRHMEDQMLRAQRLAVVGQLAAGVAHEIRNPLASISGSIELLKSSPQVDPENAALMDIVLREVDRLNGLISDLLDYARPRESVRVTFALEEVAKETVQIFSQDRSAKDVAVSMEQETPEDGLRVNADPAQLRQVIWNLLRNAAEAMPKGGTIRVRVQSSRIDGRSWGELAVIDSGMGIASEDQDRIFDPFFTTKSHGTGLGLATVHRIVMESGGTITLSSTQGLGTTFTVRLPLAPRPTPPRTVSASEPDG